MALEVDHYIATTKKTLMYDFIRTDTVGSFGGYCFLSKFLKDYFSNTFFCHFKLVIFSSISRFQSEKSEVFLDIPTGRDLGVTLVRSEE